MPGGLSNYIKAEILDHILKTGAYTQATNLYVALYTAAPTDAGGGTEVTGGSYARVNHNVWDAASVATTSATENTGTITFPTATASWGTVVAFGVLDASSAGNLIFWGDLTSNVPINNNDTASFADGAIDLTLD